MVRRCGGAPRVGHADQGTCRAGSMRRHRAHLDNHRTTRRRNSSDGVAPGNRRLWRDREFHGSCWRRIAMRISCASSSSHEHVQRYLANTEHGWGPWFFIPIVIGGTWPWFFFAAAGTARFADEIKRFRRPRIDRKGASWSSGSSRFSCSSRFRARSLAPTSCPRCPLSRYSLAVGIYRLWNLDPGRVRRIVSGFSALTMLAAVAAAIATAIAQGKISRALTLDAFLIAALLGAMAIGAFIVNREGKRPGAFVMALALGMILVMGIASRARNDAAPEVSYRNLAQQLSAALATRMRRRIVSARRALHPLLHRVSRGAGLLSRRAGSVWRQSRCGRKFYQQRCRNAPPVVSVGMLRANRESKGSGRAEKPHAGAGYCRMRREEGRAHQPSGCAC